jgi:hypothetical protein
VAVSRSSDTDGGKHLSDLRDRLRPRSHLEHPLEILMPVHSTSSPLRFDTPSRRTEPPRGFLSLQKSRTDPARGSRRLAASSAAMATFGARGLYLEAGHGKPPRAIDGDEACYTAKVSLAQASGCGRVATLLWVTLRAHRLVPFFFPF